MSVPIVFKLTEAKQEMILSEVEQYKFKEQNEQMQKLLVLDRIIRKAKDRNKDRNEEGDEVENSVLFYFYIIKKYINIYCKIQFKKIYIILQNSV